ncbi:arsenate reductase (glutaredoxin) [Lutibacter sp. B1]|uniref:arsenate reductase (glutaredoxin) n=1 Tax=Lutibacter sp. B1 TaxID=2725996 RepID=UPI001456AE37|nr:arsenate reductase (glutaredoxin) [Lutibacter sp. B1]NLP57903.1 arsenate reductase (glutaredoxin) [Lutibacter sp. B1]
MKIYHNPRCSKSRQGLAILEDLNLNFEVVKYLETPVSKEELTEIISLLNISPIDLVRRNETIWKENYKGKKLTDAQIITAMVENPKLIERPIVINNGKAIIGRPPEIIKTIL